jgi:phosphoribosylformylglycinamidine synthase
LRGASFAQIDYVSFGAGLANPQSTDNDNEIPDRSALRIVRNDEVEMKARVTVTLKSGILDPQGKAIEGALKSLGVDGISSVRQGKVFDIEISGADNAKAEAALKDAADKLLANTVIENYRVEIG